MQFAKTAGEFSCRLLEVWHHQWRATGRAMENGPKWKTSVARPQTPRPSPTKQHWHPVDVLMSSSFFLGHFPTKPVDFSTFSFFRSGFLTSSNLPQARGSVPSSSWGVAQAALEVVGGSRAPLLGGFFLQHHIASQYFFLGVSEKMASNFQVQRCSLGHFWHWCETWSLRESEHEWNSVPKDFSHLNLAWRGSQSPELPVI